MAAERALTLRGVAVDDLAWLRGWVNDPVIAEPFLFAAPVDAVAHRAWFERQQSDPSVETMLAEHRGEPVGIVVLKGIDAAQRRAEIALFVRPDRQGLGLGRSMLEAGLEAAFQQFRLRKLHLHLRADNAAAHALYTRAGFVQEGLLHAEWLHGGATHDILRLALHDDAWRAARGIGRRVALMQPSFLPWLGFFELAAVTDRLVLLDDFQVSRHSHAHRNRLFLSPGRPGLVSLPIAHGGDLSADFRTLQVASDARWWRKLRAGLAQAYARAPFLAEGLAVIEPILAEAHGSLATVNGALIRAIAARLGLATEIVSSSETPTPGPKRSARVLRLLALHQASHYYCARGAFGYMRDDGIFPAASTAVLFQDFVPHPYRQPGTDTFVPRLSALDALFMLSPDQCRRVLFGTRRWQEWSVMEQSEVIQPPAEDSVGGTDGG